MGGHLSEKNFQLTVSASYTRKVDGGREGGGKVKGGREGGRKGQGKATTS